jgi:hypothetical protein
MIERLKILSCAAELGEFTPSELARTAVANEHTVRSVLRRDEGLFEPARADATAAAPAGRGRRPGRWRVRSREDLERVIAERSAATPLPRLLQQAFLESGDDDEAEQAALDAVSLAEDAILRAWTTSVSERREALISMARDAVRAVTDDATAESGEMSKASEASQLSRRADLVLSLADVTEHVIATGEIEQDDFSAAIQAVADVAGTTGRERAIEFLDGFTALSVEFRGTLPLIWVTPTDEPPATIAEAPQHEWVHIKRGSGTLWSPTGTEPLRDAQIAAALVLDVRGGDYRTMLTEYGNARLPTIVVGRTTDRSVIADIASTGAIYLPLERAGELLAKTVVNLTMRTRRWTEADRTPMEKFFAPAPVDADPSS